MFLNSFLEGLTDEPRCEAFYINDKAGVSGKRKRRRCLSQNEPMKVLQSRLQEYAVALQLPLHSLVGFVKGKSTLDHIRPHRYRQYWYVTDFKHAFKSVDVIRLATMLWNADFRLRPNSVSDIESFTALKSFLETYTFDPEGGLMVGAAASPALFNLYVQTLVDLPLHELCKRYDLVYTRYGDDLIFSSYTQIGKHKRKHLRGIFTAAGFETDDRKTFVHDLSKGDVLQNGIGIRSNGEFFLPRIYLRKIKRAIYQVRCKEIDKAKLAGMMGTFWFCTQGRLLNKTEERVVVAYRAAMDSQ